MHPSLVGLEEIRAATEWGANIVTYAMERRLAKLQQAGYLAWPDQSDYKTKPIPEPICWIGWQST